MVSPARGRRRHRQGEDHGSAPQEHPQPHYLGGEQSRGLLGLNAFTLKGLDESKKYSLIVFPHRGVHSNMGSSCAHIIGELIRQGYLVVAPEYRGSTGYGARLFNLIDYGGLEVEHLINSLKAAEEEDAVSPE